MRKMIVLCPIILWAFFPVNGFACDENGFVPGDEQKFLPAPPETMPEENAETAKSPARMNTDELIEETVGQGATNRAFEPLYLRLAREDTATHEAFSHMIEERNKEECRCKPGRIKTAWAKLMHGVRWTLNTVIGRSVSIESTYRRLFSEQLAKANGDHDAIIRIISEERFQYTETFRSSIHADLKYAEVYLELHEIMQSAQGSGAKKLEAFKLVSRSDQLEAEILKIEMAQQEAETDGQVGRRDGKYIEMSMRRRDLFEQLQQVKVKLAEKLESWDGSRTDRRAKQEYELLNRWKLRELYKQESQIALAQMVLAEVRLEVLENILDGTLHGLNGPIDRLEIAKINQVFGEYHAYLTDGEVFGNFYAEDPSKGLSKLSEGNPVEAHNQLKEAVRHWLSLWPGRVRAVDNRLRVNFALAAVGVETTRFFAKYNLKNNKELAVRVTKGTFGGLVKAAESMGVKKQPAPKELSPEAQELLTNAEAAFDGLAQFARNELDRTQDAVSEAHGDAEQTVDVEGWVSDLQQYVTEKSVANEELDTPMRRRFQSADGVLIYNWMSFNAYANQTNGLSYSLVVTNRILVEMMIHTQDYNRLGPEMMQNIAAWTSTVVAARYAAVPMFQWFMSWFG